LRFIETILAITGGLVCVVGLSWVWFTGRLSLVVDRIFPRRPTNLPTEPTEIELYEAGACLRFTLGSQAWMLDWSKRRQPFEFKLAPDAQNRLILTVGNQNFIFGPITKCWSTLSYQFSPEPGDTISFTRSEGRLFWPIFEINIMGGTSPTRKRYVYQRLRWTKSSGSQLEILWQDKQRFYRGSGWADSYNNQLRKFTIRP
jgi:hypothetical protein